MNDTGIAQRWFREVWAGGEATIDELMASDVVGWMEGQVVNSPADFKTARKFFREVFPDLAITAEDIVEQDN